MHCAIRVTSKAEIFSSRLARRREQANRLPELAAKLVRAKVDIIVASLTPSAIAAKNATREIPIVMAPVGDPVGTGLITSPLRVLTL